MLKHVGLKLDKKLNFKDHVKDNFVKKIEDFL